MYRLTITHEEQLPAADPKPESGKRTRRRKPVTRTAMSIELTEDEYKAARVALIEALK